MTAKEKIIEYLENNRGVYISGEKLAQKLHVSRTAIWKSIKQLISEGYLIDAASSKGYMLMDSSDVLSVTGIQNHLDDGLKLSVEVYETIDSTNLAMKSRIYDNEGLVIVAKEQTAGMGRLGRRFESPEATGVYFSILLKPQIANTEVTLLTSLAAVAVCEAIEQHTKKEPKIKWVNDIFIDDKKVCGILTQAGFSLENLTPEYVIVGIGINIYPPVAGFSEEIADIAGAIFEKKTGAIKNELAASVLNSFFRYYKSFSDKSFVREYQKRSLVTGRRIMVVGSNEKKPATALEIDDMCHLIVEYENGVRDVLSTGEISIRLAD